VAMTIVHETMHARLHRRGITVTDDNRARIERVCIRAERAFAERALAGGVSDADAGIRDADRRLAWPPQVYSRTAWLSRQILAAIEVGIPRWILRLFARRVGVEFPPEPPTAPIPDADTQLKKMIRAHQVEDAALGTRRTQYGIDLAALDGCPMTIILFGIYDGRLRYLSEPVHARVRGDMLLVEREDETCVPVSPALLRRVRRPGSVEKKRFPKSKYVITATVGPPPADLRDADCEQFGTPWPAGDANQA
jgi:hypothetical protein